MTLKEMSKWAGLMGYGDPRWRFGIAEIDGEDWLIGSRADISFPMFPVATCKNADKAFDQFFKSNSWRMVEWLAGNSEANFDEAHRRLKSIEASAD